MLWFSSWVAKIRDFQRYRERWTTSWLHQKKTKSLYWKVSQVVELRPIQHHALILTCVTEFNIRDCGCLEEIFESNDRMVKYEPLVSLPQLDHIYSEKSRSDFRLTKFTKDKYQAMSWVTDVSMATSLPNLSHLYVNECKKLDGRDHQESFFSTRKTTWD